MNNQVMDGADFIASTAMYIFLVYLAIEYFGLGFFLTIGIILFSEMIARTITKKSIMKDTK